MGAIYALVVYQVGDSPSSLIKEGFYHRLVAGKMSPVYEFYNFHQRQRHYCGKGAGL